MSTAPAPPHSRHQSLTSWTRYQVAVACGFTSPDAVYRLMAAHPLDPPCSCCGGFPRPFHPMGPGGFPRWPAKKVEAWRTRMFKNAQRAGTVKG